jgi:hypothetical protein
MIIMMTPVTVTRSESLAEVTRSAATGIGRPRRTGPSQPAGGAQAGSASHVTWSRRRDNLTPTNIMPVIMMIVGLLA